MILSISGVILLHQFLPPCNKTKEMSHKLQIGQKQNGMRGNYSVSHITKKNVGMKQKDLEDQF
jgi:hypothetical protein